MNILIINDEGPTATGLNLLRQLLKQKWKEAHTLSLTPGNPTPHSSMGASLQFWREVSLADIQKNGSDDYTIFGATPTDLVDLAHLRSELFLPKGTSWDLVAAGIAHGSILGMDALRAGCTGGAMWASAAYRTSALAFAQQLPGDADEHKPGDAPEAMFRTAANIIPDYLRTAPVGSGQCWLLNFPPEQPQGYRATQPAHYSPRRLPPPQIVPRARDEQSDVAELARGFVTVTQLDLRTAKPLRF